MGGRKDDEDKRKGKLIKKRKKGRRKRRCGSSRGKSRERGGSLSWWRNKRKGRTVDRRKGGLKIGIGYREWVMGVSDRQIDVVVIDRSFNSRRRRKVVVIEER